MDTPPIARADWLEAPAGLEQIADGGITSPAGFHAAGAACGLKPSGALDLGILVCDRPATAALVDTTSALPSEPVRRNREIDAAGIRAVVVNAGTANAATGSPGLEDARRMAELASERLSIPAQEIAVCSTGTIGDRLDMAMVSDGITLAAEGLGSGAPEGFGEAIRTTDRWAKTAAFRLDLGSEEVTIGIAAKGAGMIRPGMATMLAFVTTDATLRADDAASITARAAREGFNRISVDGQMSPSDTLILVASGDAEALAGGDLERFAAGVRSACRWAAIQMVKDGEGAEHAVRVLVSGAASTEEADLVARAIGDSPLVKTAIFGRDPNLGRIEQAVGQALAGRDGPAPRLSVTLDGAGVDSADVADVMARPEYDLEVVLGRGAGSAELFAADLTHAYVTLNAEYHT